MGMDDWSPGEVVRNVQRLDKRVDDLAKTSITESTYMQGQKVMGERIEEVVKRVTTIETKREAEAENRAAEYRRNTFALLLAILSIVGSLGLFVLQLVAT